MKKKCVLFVLCMMFLVGCSEQNEEQKKQIFSCFGFFETNGNSPGYPGIL